MLLALGNDQQKGHLKEIWLIREAFSKEKNQNKARHTKSNSNKRQVKMKTFRLERWLSG